VRRAVGSLEFGVGSREWAPEIPEGSLESGVWPFSAVAERQEDGSRGQRPRFAWVFRLASRSDVRPLREIEANRRVHEELQAIDSGVAPRRTRNSNWVQGLKPLATIVPSLRDFCAWAKMANLQRIPKGFRPPARGRTASARAYPGNPAPPPIPNLEEVAPAPPTRANPRRMIHAGTVHGSPNQLSTI
jgi:hypothetical protein